MRLNFQYYAANEPTNEHFYLRVGLEKKRTCDKKTTLVSQPISAPFALRLLDGVIGNSKHAKNHI